MLTEEDCWFLDGLLEAYDELPDGAWQAACEGAIGACERFNGQDPFEVWLAWCEANAEDDAG